MNLQEHVDRLHERVDSLQEGVVNLQEHVDSLHERVDSLRCESDVGSLHERMNVVVNLQTGCMNVLIACKKAL